MTCLPHDHHMESCYQAGRRDALAEVAACASDIAAFERAHKEAQSNRQRLQEARSDLAFYERLNDCLKERSDA